MKHIILIFALAFLFIKCSYESILPKHTQQLIPSNANKVILLSELQPDSLLDFMIDYLTDNNFRITNYDKQFGIINTDGKYIDNGAMLKLNLKIIKKDDSSELVSYGDWMPGNRSVESPVEDWKQASKGEYNLSDYAYDKMVLILQNIPYKEIHFVKD